MSSGRDDHAGVQKAFYDSRAHAHLRAQQGDAYAEKLATGLARRVGIGPGHRVLEIGAGFGRFTFPLLEHCGSVVALDLSQRVLDELRRTRDQREIPERRCRTLCGDVMGGLSQEFQGSFDFVVGFFILHHLSDVPAAFAAMQSALTSRGEVAFLEPNRWNPLYLAQVLLCPDMTWREEKGMFRLSARSVGSAYRAAGLSPQATERLGFFPPQIFNRFSSSRVLETRLERLRWLRPVLPFLILHAARGKA